MGVEIIMRKIDNSRNMRSLGDPDFLSKIGWGDRIDAGGIGKYVEILLNRILSCSGSDQTESYLEGYGFFKGMTNVANKQVADYIRDLESFLANLHAADSRYSAWETETLLYGIHLLGK
jgi:hypothetical protein